MREIARRYAAERRAAKFAACADRLDAKVDLWGIRVIGELGLVGVGAWDEWLEYPWEARRGL